MAKPFVDRRSLALLTDLYQLTMAYGYWKQGLSEREAVFELTFRSNPFGGGYAVACGLSAAMDLLSCFKFSEDDTNYLKDLQGSDNHSRTCRFLTPMTHFRNARSRVPTCPGRSSPPGPRPERHVPSGTVPRLRWNRTVPAR